MTDDPFAPASARPLWLVTLADLALLLLGFVVLVQATGNREGLARALRERFGAVEAAPPLPVAATATDFAPGSAALGDAAPLVAWAREALADPRVTVTVTGAAAPEEASGVLIAADRARAVAAALTGAGLPAERILIATARPSAARAVLTLAFAGEPHRNRP